jgi:hypothetical protein
MNDGFSGTYCIACEACPACSAQIAKTSDSTWGLQVNLGHTPTDPCPQPDASLEDFMIIYTTGVHVVHVNFCGCKDALSRHVQLLRMHWWPATALQLRTAATMEVLHTF